MEINNSKYFLNGGVIQVGGLSGSVMSSIPVGNWEVKFNPKEGKFYLEALPAFSLPSKVYGSVDNDVKRYLNTFNTRDESMGILLSGLKGTGKSLLAKALCMQANMPVLIINDAYSGPEFNTFIAGINQPCVIFFDEFEKVYREKRVDEYGEDRTGEVLLSLFDGAYNTKKIFLLTCNEVGSISGAFKNRPGRIRYTKTYNGLGIEFMKEIIEDKLVHKQFQEDFLQTLPTLGEMNIDLLVAIIDEMNMYKESATESLSYLNIEPTRVMYNIRISGSYTSMYGGVDDRFVSPLDFIGDSSNFAEGKYDFYLDDLYARDGDLKNLRMDFEGALKDLTLDVDRMGNCTVVNKKEDWTLTITKIKTEHKSYKKLSL